MQVGVLGPLMVVDGQREIAVPGSRLRALLMTLTAHVGTDVSAQRLIDALWGDDPPANAANALQALVSKLRRVLGPAGPAVMTVLHGYRLDLPLSAIDAPRFEAAVVRGRSLLADGDPEKAGTVLSEALSWWRGAPFDGATEGALHDEAVRLEELRVNALEDRVDADLQAGRHFEVVGELAALVVEFPLRERIHALSMLALYRCGRQAEALRVYATARQTLLEELGIDPSAELQQLEARILRQEPSLDPPASATAHAAFGTTLPQPVGAFIGREEELEDVAALVERSRLVCVVGPGGAGKTRLAIEVGHRWVDRAQVWFVDLAPLARDGSVVDAVAAAAGCDAGDARSGATGHLERLVAHVARRPSLMIVDNCEHVIQEAAFVVDRLVRACGELRVLATSREALRVNGEIAWPLRPLSESDGVALFAECAARSSGLQIEEAAEPKVRELCRRLDGMPLAIELAASRAGAMSVDRILARLDDRFRVLTSGARTAAPRQQTLRAVVEWSYELLSDVERRVFNRLAVFAASWSLDAAEAVVTDETIAAADVAALLG